MMMKKILCFILGSILGAQGAWADLYDVPPVAVMAEGASAQEARHLAIENGQAEAFWVLVNKMVDPEDVARISLPQADVLQDLVQNVSLSDEKNTSTKYKAMLSVRFHPEKIQAFLIERQIPYLTQEMPKTLVLPVFVAGDEVSILEENNPVFLFLKMQGIEEPFVLPVGDLEEMTFVREAWLSGDRGILQDLAKKYEASRVLVWQVTQQGPYVMGQTQSVPIRAELPDVTDEAVAPTGIVDDVLADMWQKIERLQTEAWRAAKINDLSAPNLMWVKVPVQTLKEWSAIQKRLATLGEDVGVSVRGFRPNEVLLALSTRATAEELMPRLQSLGLILTLTDASDVWLLTQATREEQQ